MFFRRDGQCYCKGKSVGIYEESEPTKTLHRTTPEMAAKLTTFLNTHIYSESFICGNCGRLLINLVYVKRHACNLGQRKEGGETGWVGGRFLQWEYLCNECKASIPRQQLEEMGVIGP
jgi:hypothetical protein